MPSIIAVHGGGLVPGDGGLPILRDGVLLGAVGVGGASDRDDEHRAQAGVARL